ncbi:MAG: enoyl-CoA hydratase-related protein [Treponema sp.]|nr:enoyl-CoA hydratase-related protein [Treponema sp.]
MNGFENDDLLFRVDGHVATITLNRPDAYNALSDDMRDGLRKAADALRQNRSEIRIAVLTGAGKAFCSGGDIKLMKKRIDDGVSYRERLETYRRDVADMVRELRGIRQPVVAKINGATYGAGCSLAMLCDLRIACDSAKFGLPFGKRALIPDWGSTYFLPRIVGLSKAISLCSTGRSFDAAEALQMGFLDEVVAAEELDSRVEAFCEEVLQSGPFSIMEAKAAMTRGLDLSLDAALEIEARVQSECFVSDDHREGVDCFLEKRPPSFTGK